MRSPSVFWDSSLRPSFLRTTPAKKPRTECGCHPVVLMIAAIVVPSGWLNSASTLACLEFARDAAACGAFDWAAFLAWPLLDRPEVAFLTVLLLDIVGSFHQW